MKIIIMEVRNEDLRRVINNILLVREDSEAVIKKADAEPLGGNGVELLPEHISEKPKKKLGRPRKKELSPTAEALKEIEEETTKEEDIDDF